MEYTLPDGRKPIRFGKGNTAFYAKLRGTGEVEYTFAMIRYMVANRPRLSSEKLSAIAKERAKKLREKDPEFFNKIGQKGGKVKKNG